MLKLQIPVTPLIGGFSTVFLWLVPSDLTGLPSVLVTPQLHLVTQICEVPVYGAGRACFFVARGRLNLIVSAGFDDGVGAATGAITNWRT
jgi:hypothetical protein